MADRQVAMTSVVSGVLWCLGVAIVVTGVLLRIYGVPAIGLLMAGAGGVLNIRGFVMRCEQQMRNAFQCGRDFEKAHQPTAVRSVN